MKAKSRHLKFALRGSAVNSFPTDDDRRNFCGQGRSRSDCTECAIRSSIYTSTLSTSFVLDYS